MKVKRMTVLSSIRARQVSAAMLSVILFAWVSVVAAQCGTTAVSYAQGRVELNGRALQYDCAHTKSVSSIAGSERCCAPTTVVSGDASKLPEVTLLCLPSADPGYIHLTIVSDPKLDSEQLSADEHFPPVYLTTQRLRI